MIWKNVFSYVIRILNRQWRPVPEICIVWVWAHVQLIPSMSLSQMAQTHTRLSQLFKWTIYSAITDVTLSAKADWARGPINFSSPIIFILAPKIFLCSNKNLFYFFALLAPFYHVETNTLSWKDEHNITTPGLLKNCAKINKYANENKLNCCKQIFFTVSFTQRYS